MKDQAYFIGVDVSKKRLDTWVLPVGKAIKAENNQKGIKRLCKQLSQFRDALVVVEATGKLHNTACAAMHEAGLQVAVVNPRQVRDFAKAMGILAKTDRIDAAVLAEFANKVRPTPRPLKGEQAQELSDFVARRRQLIDMIVMEKNRLKSAPKRIKRKIKAHLEWLKKELSSLDEEMDQFIKGNSVWRAKEEVLKSVPGVGNVLSRSLLSDLPELGSLDRHGIAALVGLAPFNVDSGNHRGRRRCWGGRKHVRRALYMATLSATCHNEVISTYYRKLRDQGKEFKVAMVACMRKLLVILNAMVRDNKPWSPI